MGCVVVWAFYLLLCAGCASREVNVALTYAPVGRGLLSDLKSAVVSLRVVDQRPQEQRKGMGVQPPTISGAEPAVVISQSPAVQVVHNAIRTELERSGHRVLAPGQGHAELTIRVGLTQFLLDSKVTDSHIELLGSIQADVIAFASAGKTPGIYLFVVESAYPDLVPLGLFRPVLSGGAVGMLSSTTSKSHVKETMDRTLEVFMRRFCLAPELRRVFTQVAE